MVIKIGFNQLLAQLADEPSLRHSHISLLASLYSLLEQNKFEQPFCISRKQLMRLSRLGSKHTYYLCLADLVRLAILEYTPTYNSFVGSTISFRIVAPEETASDHIPSKNSES